MTQAEAAKIRATLMESMLDFPEYDPFLEYREYVALVRRWIVQHRQVVRDVLPEGK